MSDATVLPSPARAPAPVLSFGPGVQRGAPLLTIAIPAYRGPGLLREALASIATQTDLRGVEVVVCDDGRLVETRRVVRETPLRNVRYYVNRRHLGAVANWNRCLRLARGRWVTILHEDDTLYPWFVATIRPRLRAGVAAVAVRCVQGAQPPDVEHARASRDRVYEPAWFLKSSMTPFPGVVFPRELGLRLGGFDAREAGIADYAFWYALARAGRVEVLGTTAAFYRRHDGQWTEGEWPAMLRRAHLLRLRVAREQFPDHPDIGRWFARFYTARMARSYERRFAQRPATLARARRLERIPLAWLPSGWVWKFLQHAPRLSSETLLSFPPLPQSQRISPS